MARSAWRGRATGYRIDLRLGGRWELTMVPRGGGPEFTIGYEIVELVVPQGLIVLRSDPMPEAGIHDPTVVRVEFHRPRQGDARRR